MKKPLMIIGARQVGKTYIINEFKKFNTKDAAGFFTAKACGIFTVVITGRRCQATERRMKEMLVVGAVVVVYNLQCPGILR